MSTTRTRTAKWYASAIASSHRAELEFQAAADNLKDLAVKLGSAAIADEAKRLESIAREMGDDAESLMDEAACAGYTPDDIFEA